MLIELTGDVIGVSYSHGSWKMEVELKQDMPENGFRKLGSFQIRVTKDDVDEVTTGDVKFVKVLIEV